MSQGKNEIVPTMLMALQIEEMSTNQERWVPLKLEKAKKEIFP